jgi:hypothetical protein
MYSPVKNQLSAAMEKQAKGNGAGAAPSGEADMYGLYCRMLTAVSVLLFIVTFHANLAHSLTRSP